MIKKRSIGVILYPTIIWLSLIGLFGVIFLNFDNYSKLDIALVTWVMGYTSFYVGNKVGQESKIK